MSRTRRIYNNPRLKKAQRYNLDNTIDIHPLFGMHIGTQTGIPLTKKSWICMGHCPQCRDKNKELKTVRKRTEEEFRLRMMQEHIILRKI